MSSSPDLSSLLSTVQNITPSSFPTDLSRKEFLVAINSLVHRIEKPMESLLRMAWIEPSYTACVKIGLDIGLFQVLADGRPYSIEELAVATKTDGDLLERILRHLASMDTISELEVGIFVATDFSKALTMRSCSSAVDYRYLFANPAFQHLPEFLQKTSYRNPKDLLASPWQFAIDTKLSFFDWVGSNPAALEMFTNHMAGYTSQRGTWEDVYPIREKLLSPAEGDYDDLILIDLGGGAGHDLKRFASNFLANSNKQCLVLQDLPEVIDSVKSSSSLPPTIKAVAVDLTKEAPVAGSRAYYMHSVLHDWPDSDVQKILRQMHPTLLQLTRDGRKPRLLLNENVIRDKGVQPQQAALDLIMMAAFASHERSEKQWKSVLESAGYRINAIFSKLGIDEAVIEAEAVVE